jgi:hypothetical protein
VRVLLLLLLLLYRIKEDDVIRMYSTYRICKLERDDLENMGLGGNVI